MFDPQLPFIVLWNPIQLEDQGVSGTPSLRRFITFFKGQHPALPALAVWSKHIQEVVVMYNLEIHTEFKVSNTPEDG